MKRTKLQSYPINIDGKMVDVKAFSMFTALEQAKKIKEKILREKLMDKREPEDMVE